MKKLGILLLLLGLFAVKANSQVMSSEYIQLTGTNSSFWGPTLEEIVIRRDEVAYISLVTPAADNIWRCFISLRTPLNPVPADSAVTTEHLFKKFESAREPHVYFSTCACS